uniref:Uncharacterized protein n=1 Tax=Oryzias latipes TaxID=8090 RepID=A0A286P9Y1_ORYLA|nr:hypothetical protein [Oryzias latipes]
MEAKRELCCSLYRALALDPVPVIGGVLYAPGTEGVSLRSLGEGTTNCSHHRFNFRHAVDALLRHGTKEGPCTCAQRLSASAEQRYRGGDGADVPNPERRRRGATKPGGQGSSREIARAQSEVLWAYEMEPVAAAYRWLMCNRSARYPKCCDSVLVYQVDRSRTLPPGLYVYKSRPSHFGCTAERPLCVVDQFNFRVQRRGPASVEEEPHCFESALPKEITLELFPGRDNFSALYVIGRAITAPTPEYGNRLFGEALALDLVSPESCEKAVACKHHLIGMRTEQACVIDLRWNSFDVMSACMKAVPKIRGMQAVVWSNHVPDPVKIESDVLAWLFGYVTVLPAAVRSVDYKNESLGVRYIIVDVDGFSGTLPEPPEGEASCFAHTYFEGDVGLAAAAIGELPEASSRMGSPRAGSPAFWYELPASLGTLKPTPFSSGSRSRRVCEPQGFRDQFRTWALGKTDGACCLAIAVQHTLYYHARDREYRLMVTHTVLDGDTSLNIYKL